MLTRLLLLVTLLAASTGNAHDKYGTTLEKNPPPIARILSMSTQQSHYQPGRLMDMLEDAGASLTLEDVMSPERTSHFQHSEAHIPNVGASQSAWWFRMDIHNEDDVNATWLLENRDSMFQYVDFYIVRNDGSVDTFLAGSMRALSERRMHSPYHLARIDLAPHETLRIYVRTQTDWAFVVPLDFWQPASFDAKTKEELLLHGVYFGVILAMVSYNLFAAFALREKTYFMYAAFMISIGAYVGSLNGVFNQYLLTENPTLLNGIFKYSIYAALITGAIFSRLFLSDKIRTIRTVCDLFVLMAALCAIIDLASLKTLWVKSISVVSVLQAITLFIMGAWRAAKGDRSALYYVAGFGAFLFGTVFFGIMLMGGVPSSTASYNAIEIGSGIEAILLSLALAQRIRLIREGKERAELESMHHQQSAAEHKVLALDTITHYNKKLEAEVEARTRELKQTQQRLVSSEKMTALGVFTAGMAHEINNPANFASVGAQNTAVQLQRLRNFIRDLMQHEHDAEIEAAFSEHFDALEKSNRTVLEGVERIEDVVKKLQASHPEGDVGLQPADLGELLDSAWQVVASGARTNIHVTRDYKCHTLIHCRIGEMNQVCMALLLNAIQAIDDLQEMEGAQFKGYLTLASRANQHHIYLTVRDNGVGMPPIIMDKMFDPFFTTKAVGRGSGLGLSSARDIVIKHGGHIEAQSKMGMGTSMTVVLPLET